MRLSITFFRYLTGPGVGALRSTPPQRVCRLRKVQLASLTRELREICALSSPEQDRQVLGARSRARALLRCPVVDGGGSVPRGHVAHEREIRSLALALVHLT